MARAHDSMVNPPIENLLDQVDSKFSLVTFAAKRARQINAYFSQLGQGLGTMVPPQVTSVARKPLSIGFEEIAAGKMPFVEWGADEALAKAIDSGRSPILPSPPTPGRVFSGYTSNAGSS